jgi:membrane fusion protein, adhesin transport system
MSPLDAIIGRQKSSKFRIAALLIVLLLAALFAWASQAKLDEVATAIGEVVPQGQIKSIQHLEGGIIEEMYVTEGDLVAAGDPLVRLDLSASNNQEAELRVTLDGLMLRRARLLAEANGGEPEFPSDVAERRAAVTANELNAFQARKEEMTSALAGLQQEVNQRDFEIRQQKAEEASLRDQFRMAQENFAIAQDLMPDGLISRLDFLDAEAEAERIRGQLESLAESIPAAEAAFEQARERIHETEIAFRRAALEDLSQVELSIDHTTEELIKASAMSNRTLISSPIDGIVKSLRFYTIGAVVKPGEILMDIVPSNDMLVIEARLNPQDVGYVEAGQKAVVKISTYDYIRYGGLDAEVILVSPDSLQDADGNTYFRVIAATDRSYLGSEPGDLPITAGMEATLDIHTGSNTVLHYLLKPVLKLKSEAFRER